MARTRKDAAAEATVEERRQAFFAREAAEYAKRTGGEAVAESEPETPAVAADEAEGDV